MHGMYVCMINLSNVYGSNLTRGDRGWEPAGRDARVRGERCRLPLPVGRLGREFAGLLGIENDYVVGNESAGPGSTTRCSRSRICRRGHTLHHHPGPFPSAPMAAKT